jgi:ribosome modulation factor
MSSKAQLTKARTRGQQAGAKKKPRNTNPYGQGDKRFEEWDAAWKQGNAEAGQ